MDTKENKLLQLIEEADDYDDVLYYQISLMNHYLKTNQLDKRAALYAEYKALIKELEELDEPAEENEKEKEVMNNDRYTTSINRSYRRI